MKQIFSIILLLILFQSWSQEKTLDKVSIEIIYTKAYKNFKDSTNAAPKLMKDLEYKLLCNTYEARFEYLTTMTNDVNGSNKRFIGKGGGNGVYYKNLKDYKNIRFVNKYETDFLIQEEFNKYEWKLLRDSKKILGYDCFKAIGSYKEYNYYLKKEQEINIIVWYAPNLAIPFGPSGYDGLPGLVLESYRTSFHFIATSIKFYDKVLEIKQPIKGKVVTLDEYNKILNNNWLDLTD